jgi:hypothetical protein
MRPKKCASLSPQYSPLAADAVLVDGRSYAAPTQLSKVATPPAPAAKNLGEGLRRPCSADV